VLEIVPIHLHTIFVFRTKLSSFVRYIFNYINWAKNPRRACSLIRHTSASKSISRVPGWAAARIAARRVSTGCVTQAASVINCTFVDICTYTRDANVYLSHCWHQLTSPEHIVAVNESNCCTTLAKTGKFRPFCQKQRPNRPMFSRSGAFYVVLKQTQVFAIMRLFMLGWVWHISYTHSIGLIQINTGLQSLHPTQRTQQTQESTQQQMQLAQTTQNAKAQSYCSDVSILRCFGCVYCVACVALNEKPDLIMCKLYMCTRAHAGLPMQVCPSPVYPGLHVHLWLPTLLVQTASALQPPLFVAHSSISAYW